MEKYKMKRSSSAANMLKIDFNPSQFCVGYSKVQQLPIKTQFRRYSAHNIQRIKTNLENSEVETLKRLNEVYRRQNEQLKRQIETYKKANLTKTCMGKRQSIPRGEDKVSNYKDLIKSKLESKSRCSRVNTECQTGLFSSKEISYSTQQQTIAEYYQAFKSSKSMPTFQDLEDISKRFFLQYAENYAKIKCILASLQNKEKHQGYRELCELFQIFKVPLLYQKNPKSLMKQLSRQKDLKKSKEEQNCLQILSPEETIKRFEGMIGKIIKSASMLRIIRGSELMRKLIGKVVDAKHS